MKFQRNQIVRRSESQVGRFRRTPPMICGFFKSNGTCRAGERCPMAHKIPRNAHPTTGLSDPNPDPGTVALLFRAVYMGPLDPPKDKTMKTLYIRRLNASVEEAHLRDCFSRYGEIDSIRYFDMKGVRCAFLTYTTRQAAEKAMLELSSWVEVNGQMLKLLWGAHQIPKHAEQVGGWVKQDDGSSWGQRYGGEVPSWSKRSYGCSEQSGGCGFDGWGNWDVGAAGSSWGKRKKAVGGFGECFNWGRANDVGGGSNLVIKVDGSSWGQQDGGGGGPSWSTLGDCVSGFGGGWETVDDDVKSSGDADNAWG